MDINQVIAAAETTSNPRVQELTNGTTEAILTFGKRKIAESVALTLREAGATVRHIHPHPLQGMDPRSLLDRLAL